MRQDVLLTELDGSSKSTLVDGSFALRLRGRVIRNDTGSAMKRKRKRLHRIEIDRLCIREGYM
jgi:hypothetical protein